METKIKYRETKNTKIPTCCNGIRVNHLPKWLKVGLSWQPSTEVVKVTEASSWQLCTDDSLHIVGLVIGI